MAGASAEGRTRGGERRISAEQAPLNVTAGWEGIFEGVSRERLETVYLPEYLPKQRWFAGKSRHIQSTRIVDWTAFERVDSALAFVEVQFDTGASELYLALLAMTFGDAADELRRAAPNAIVASIISAKVSGLLHDGVFDDKACLELLSLIENGRELQYASRTHPRCAWQGFSERI